MIDLKGKVALITGGSRGVGAATAIKFADAGADVVISYTQARQEADRVVDQCLSRGVKALAVRANVGRFAEVGQLFEQAIKAFGRIDILVANAGVWKRAPVDEMTEEQWDETIDVNLKGTYACCHFAARVMKKQSSGRIITVSSTAGQRGEAFYSHYAASKGGMISLTKSLAAELGPFGITVNSVAPGWIDTDMSADPIRIPSELAKIVAVTPLKKVATPEEVADPILFLASDLASHITGEILNVNGGSVLCG